MNYYKIDTPVMCFIQITLTILLISSLVSLSVAAVTSSKDETVGRYIDYRTGFVEKWNILESQQDYQKGLLSTDDMSAIGKEYARGDTYYTLSVKESRIILDPPKKTASWVPDAVIESLIWLDSKENRSLLHEYMMTGTSPPVSAPERSVRSHISALENGIAMSRLTYGELPVYTGVSPSIADKFSDENRFVVIPDFLYGSYDPSIALTDAIEEGRDGNGFSSVLVTTRQVGDGALFGESDGRRILLPHDRLWYAYREVLADTVSFETGFPLVYDDIYHKIRFIFLEEASNSYRENMGF